MSGSFKHCAGEDGSFRFDLIENMRDARGACEEMFFMIWWLADRDPQRVEAALDAYYRSVNSDYDEVKAKLGRQTFRPPSGESDAIRFAFLRKVLPLGANEATTAQMERLADGIIAALKAFDEIATINRKRHL